MQTYNLKNGRMVPATEKPGKWVKVEAHEADSVRRNISIVELGDQLAAAVTMLEENGLSSDNAFMLTGQRIVTEQKAQTIREFVDLFLRSIDHEGSPGFDGLTSGAFADFVDAYIKHRIKGMAL